VSGGVSGDPRPRGRPRHASDYPPSIIGKGRTGEEQIALERAHDQALIVNPVTGAIEPLHSAQFRANMRLEALRLAHRADLDPAAMIDRVNTLLAWLLEQPADKPE